MPVETLPRRIEAIQVLRAIAALLVVVVHAVNVDDERLDWGRSVIGAWPSLNDFGAIGVDVFFVLSGFVMAHTITLSRSLTARQFLHDRYVRVVPVYWLASVAYLAAMLLVGRRVYAPEVLEAVTVFPLATPLHFSLPVLLVGWSLAYELAFYGVVALVTHLRGQGAPSLALLLGCVMVLGTVGAVAQPRVDLLAIWINPIWYEFGFGIAIYLLWKRSGGALPNAAGWTAGAVCIAGVAHALFVGVPFSSLPFYLLDGHSALPRAMQWGVPAAALVLWMLWWSARPGMDGRLAQSRLWQRLLVLGDASYMLYLTHMLVIIPGQELLPAVRHGVDLLILAEVALCSAIAIACHRRLEKPLLRALRQARATPAPMAAPERSCA